MTLEQCLGRKYKFEKSENFEEFLKAFGVGYLIRKMAQLASPVVELRRDGDTYTFRSASTFKTSVLSFRLGDEFEEVRHDGALVRSVIQRQDACTLFHLQRGDRDTTITRRFTPESLTIAEDDIEVLSLQVTYKTAFKIARSGIPFCEEEYVKECVVEAVELLYPPEFIWWTKLVLSNTNYSFGKVTFRPTTWSSFQN